MKVVLVCLEGMLVAEIYDSFCSIPYLVTKQAALNLCGLDNMSPNAFISLALSLG